MLKTIFAQKVKQSTFYRKKRTKQGADELKNDDAFGIHSLLAEEIK